MSEDYSPYAMAADMVAKRDARIAALEAELAEAKALNAEMRRLLENVGFNYNNVSGVGYPTVPPAWFDERDALLNPNPE